MTTVIPSAQCPNYFYTMGADKAARQPIIPELMNHHPYQPDQRTGVWLDQKNAYLITVSADEPPVIEHLSSAIERVPADGHASFDRQSSQQRHDHHELQVLFKEIVERLRNVDYVYVFGPGNAKHELAHAIEKEGLHFRCKLAGLDPATKMSRNQMQQKAAAFFTSLRYENAKRELAEV